ncbi:hypothetical protein COLO4_38576 [Corchorus olitorius]|uniref:GAG-pre-integrase domain-containing protein n=1 Tax=Corchorus olitorius TaxID=93759 RepID=A0A1R3FU98_9ROSI|nr:hypothetical protein COLO4_38576 [Corchorus olitorius]
MKSSSESAETSALVTTQVENDEKASHADGKAYAAYKHKSKGKPKCDHCNGVGHIKDKCWILHPHLRPKKVKSHGDRSTAQVAANDDRSMNQVVAGDTQISVKKLAQLLQQLSKSSMTSTTQGSRVGEGVHHNGLYLLVRQNKALTSRSCKNENFSLWHSRMGHPSNHVLIDSNSMETSREGKQGKVSVINEKERHVAEIVDPVAPPANVQQPQSQPQNPSTQNLRRLIVEVLSRRHHTDLVKVCFQSPYCESDTLGRESYTLEELIAYAVDHNVQQLTIQSDVILSFMLPKSLWTSLKSLHIHGCSVSNESLNADDLSGFPNLETLELIGILCWEDNTLLFVDAPPNLKSWNFLSARIMREMDAKLQFVLPGS